MRTAAPTAGMGRRTREGFLGGSRTFVWSLWAMSALVLHVAHNARGALGFAFVATRKSGGYRGVASTAHRRSSRFFTEQIRSTQLTRRIRGYYCSMSAVSPEASPPSSINNTLRKEHQHEHQISSYYTSAELEKEFQIWDRLCDLEVPEGRVVGLNLRDFGPDDPDSLEPDTVTNNATGHWIYSLLHPDEVAYAIELPSKARRETFFIGRVAIREALERLGRNEPPTNNEANSNDHSLTNINSIPPIMKDEHGRPTMPKGYVGSISHKDRAGVGIVARDITFCSPDDPPKFGIGIDLERTTNKRRSIARRVLTENEIESLGQLEDVTEEEEVMLRFSLKECIYKAVHPLICQYVGFQEAEVTPHANGTATVEWKLKSGAQVRLAEITAHWQRLDGGEYFLSSSSAALLDDDKDDSS